MDLWIIFLIVFGSVIIFIGLIYYIYTKCFRQDSQPESNDSYVRIKESPNKPNDFYGTIEERSNKQNENTIISINEKKEDINPKNNKNEEIILINEKRIDMNDDEEEEKNKLNITKNINMPNIIKNNENNLKEDKCPHCFTPYILESCCFFITCNSIYCRNEKHFCHICKTKLTHEEKIRHLKYGLYEPFCVKKPKT